MPATPRPSQRSPSPTTATTRPAAAPPSASTDCTTADLAVAVGSDLEPARGHVAVVLTFRNTSSRPCSITAYPGVALLDGHDRQAVQAVRVRRSYLGGLSTPTVPTVHLRPGSSASDLLAGTSNPVGGQTSCPTYAGLLVTPPDETHAVRVGSRGFRTCTPPEVTPVVAGTRGGGSGDG